MQTSLEALLAPFLEAGVPGVSAVVVSSSGLIEHAAAGVRRKGAVDVVEPRDRFHLGSNTCSIVMNPWSGSQRGRHRPMMVSKHCLATSKVAAIKGHIETRARQLKRCGDPRSMDQLRADISVDLLLGKDRGGRHGGVITLTADLETLAELAAKAADLPGLGPVIADIANQVLGDHPDAEIRYRITTPDGPATGTPGRFAARALRRHIETRDMT